MSSWVIMLDGFLLSAGARTQSVVAQSSCEAESPTAATSKAMYIQALFSACGQHVSIDLRSNSSGAIGVGFAAPPASERAVLVATARNSPQEGLNQQSARTRERGRRQHEACATALNIASLPMRMGGLLLRRATPLAPAAHWALWADASQMVDQRLPEVANRVVNRLAADEEPAG